MNIHYCLCGTATENRTCLNEKCARLDSGNYYLKPECAEFAENKHSVLTSSWFHTTSNPDWHYDVMDADVAVHVGTHKASIDRQRLLSGFSEDCYLFEVGIYTDSTVAPHLSEDLQDGWPTQLGDFEVLSKRNEILRYINEVEDADGISLLLNPHCLYVKSVYVFDEELSDFVLLDGSV